LILLDLCDFRRAILNHMTLGKPLRLRSGQERISAVTILVTLVMLLVPALAWMQYQWLGQLSTAERERMQRTLRTAAAQFATEFDTELSRTLVSLQVDGQSVHAQNWTTYAQRYSAWVTSASEPRLVREVLLIDTLPGTTLPVLGNGVPADRLRIRKWNAPSLAFEDTAWPDDLTRMRAMLATRFIGIDVQPGRPLPEGPGSHREASLSITTGDDNTLVAPVTLFELPEERRPAKISILGFTVVKLEPAVVRDTILAALASRHFHGDGAEADYRVAIVQKDDLAKVVWESEPGIAKLVTDAPDVKQNFMGPRPDQMLVFARNLRADAQIRTVTIPPPPPPPAPGELPGRPSGPTTKIDLSNGNMVVSVIEKDRRGGGRGERGGERGFVRGPFGEFEGRWTLMAKHRTGSLEAAVAQVRMRNLGISSSILLLLTLAVGLIVVSARRAQNLARQQMEFVAAVSHELRTPVSVIGAAAGNLADGVVGDPQRVRKYGETIQGEARRLAETVERVLQLAGIAAGTSAAAQVPIRPQDLIDQSLSSCRTEIDAAGCHVEVAVADDLPMVVGDTAALRSALQNLISNAVKYGGSAKWLRVSASAAPGSVAADTGTVLFSVEDRGLGIEAEDRKHIFEPFYRGREAVSQQIQGSGLGLNLVHRIAEAHGGKVGVTSEPGKGSTFTLSLPAVHDRPAAELNLVRQAPSPR
jgi:two-component system sensor histidine kinase SenX3